MTPMAGADGDVLDVDFDGLLRNPMQFPLRLSLADDALTFIQVRRLDYRRASFLDPRGLPPDALMWQAAVSALHEALDPPAAPASMAYLFHTGFCCSTLLSRCAEISPQVFALREPMSLHNLEAQLAGVGRDWGREEWHRALAVLLTLLGRTWDARQTALIKADCTLLVPALLQYHPAPYVVLYSPVRDFLAAVMSCQTRRAWSIGRLRQMLEIARAADIRVPFDVPPRLQAPEATILIWWWQMSIFRDARQIGRTTSLFLAADAFLNDPIPALRTVLDTLGVNSPAAMLPALAARVMSRDAKTPAQHLDAASRRRKLASAHSAHAEQIEKALDWASGWIGRETCDL